MEIWAYDQQKISNAVTNQVIISIMYYEVYDILHICWKGG